MLEIISFHPFLRECPLARPRFSPLCSFAPLTHSHVHSGKKKKVFLISRIHIKYFQQYLLCSDKPYLASMDAHVSMRRARLHPSFLQSSFHGFFFSLHHNNVPLSHSFELNLKYYCHNSSAPENRIVFTAYPEGWKLTCHSVYRYLYILPIPRTLN